MCGIFALLNNKVSLKNDIIQTAFDKGNSRGPESSNLITYSDKIVLGFKRLAINGLDEMSGQPMTIDGVTIVCNGEIYNFNKLYEMMGVSPSTGSDCEVIIRMYKKYGFEYTLTMLDGVFALILYDMSSGANNPNIYIARDPFGVRPLYVLESGQLEANSVNSVNGEISNTTTESLIGFASEIKSLSPLLGESGFFMMKKRYDTKVFIQQHNDDDEQKNFTMKQFKINHFLPGTYSHYTKSFLVNSEWELQKRNVNYFKILPPLQIASTSYQDSLNQACKRVVKYLNRAVEKRVVGTTERPIACLLSGGLDSSIIAALVKRHYKGNENLKTFSIGMEGSEDIKYAKLVAGHLGTDHTEVILKPNDFFDAIPEVIEKIESYDTTTVRASVGNYLIGKYIAENTDAKVVFNGDGSDEVTGGYLYFLHAPDDLSFDKECRRLVGDIHKFDVLRSDKCISSHGLEPRTPFLDRAFVSFYMSLPIELRNPLSHKGGKKCEKFLLRSAIEKYMPELLPKEIVWRTKEAFSDGISGNQVSWFEIIKEKVEHMGELVSDTLKHNNPTTQEQGLYRSIYDACYPGTEENIPYFWMPRFVNAFDSSARTLQIYSERNK